MDCFAEPVIGRNAVRSRASALLSECPHVCTFRGCAIARRMHATYARLNCRGVHIPVNSPLPHPADSVDDGLRDYRLRERETTLKEKIAAHEMALKARELEAKLSDQKWSRWMNPLVLAIFAAALAASGNALLAYINGSAQKTLEETKAEASRILEVIKTADQDQAVTNLKFLLEAGLITDEARRRSLETFLANRKPGEGPSIPPPGAASSSGHPNYNLPPPADNPAQTRAANRLLRVAVAEINRNVDEETAVERIQQYWRATNAQMSDVKMPWSAAFLSWLIREAGNNDGLPMSALNIAIWNDAVGKKLTFAPNEKPVLPGDIFLQTRVGGGAPSVDDIRAGKIDLAPTSSGIVYAVAPEKISVISGNTGNAIRLRDLSLSNAGLVGFIRLSDAR